MLWLSFVSNELAAPMSSVTRMARPAWRRDEWGSLGECGALVAGPMVGLRVGVSGWARARRVSWGLGYSRARGLALGQGDGEGRSGLTVRAKWGRGAGRRR